MKNLLTQHKLCISLDYNAKIRHFSQFSYLTCFSYLHFRIHIQKNVSFVIKNLPHPTIRARQTMNKRKL